MKTGDRIKKRREELGISVDEVAKKLGKHRATIYRYESNDIGTLPTDVLEPLAIVLETTPAALMGWEDFRPPHASNLIVIEPMGKIPLVGQIACGTPILAEENIDDYVDLPRHIRADFALTCKGDSMVNAGIRSGDVVYIRKQEQVENGQIAAVRVGDEEATLKRFYFDGESVRLVAENPSCPTMSFFGPEIEKVHIEGLAIGYTHALEK